MEFEFEKDLTQVMNDINSPHFFFQVYRSKDNISFSATVTIYGSFQEFDDWWANWLESSPIHEKLENKYGALDLGADLTPGHETIDIDACDVENVGQVVKILKVYISHFPDKYRSTITSITKRKINEVEISI